MGKPKRKNKGNTGPRPVDPAAILAELESHAEAMVNADSSEVGPMWGAAHKLLLKAKANPAQIMPIIGRRDLDGLRALIAAMQSGTPVSEDEATPSESATEIDPEVLRKAMRAFRKRLKLARLDHESRLGVGPMSGGKKSDIDAILAPQEFPAEVWEALATSGELRSAGGGFYQLANESSAH